MNTDLSAAPPASAAPGVVSQLTPEARRERPPSYIVHAPCHRRGGDGSDDDDDECRSVRSRRRFRRRGKCASRRRRNAGAASVHLRPLALFPSRRRRTRGLRGGAVRKNRRILLGLRSIFVGRGRRRRRRRRRRTRRPRGDRNRSFRPLRFTPASSRHGAGRGERAEEDEGRRWRRAGRAAGDGRGTERRGGGGPDEDSSALRQKIFDAAPLIEGEDVQAIAVEGDGSPGDIGGYIKRGTAGAACDVDVSDTGKGRCHNCWQWIDGVPE